MRHRWAKLGALGILAAICPLGGCYERVVSAKGMGAQGVTVAQPNVQETSGSRTLKQKRIVKLKNASTK